MVLRRWIFLAHFVWALGGCGSGLRDSADAAIDAQEGDGGGGPRENTAPEMVEHTGEQAGPVDVPFVVTALCRDDRLPKPGLVSYRWAIEEGDDHCELGSPTEASTTVLCDELGTITLEARCCDQGTPDECTGLSDSETFDVTIRTPLLLDRIAGIEGRPFSRGAYVISHAVSAHYTGPSIRIRRSTDSAMLDVGFVDDLLDEQAIEELCAGTDCFIERNYDKSGNGNLLVAPNFEAQPKIYDADTGIVRRGSLPSAKLSSPTGGEAQRWVRGDLLGIGPFRSLAMFYIAKHGRLEPVDRVVAALGGGGRQAFVIGAHPNGELSVGLSNHGLGPPATRRLFTPQQDVTEGMAHYLASMTSRSFVPSITLRQNGVMLTASDTGDAQSMRNDGAHVGIGAYAEASSQNFDGLMNGAIFFDGVPTGRSLELLMDFGNDLVELAEGSRPPAADLSKITRYIVVAGQSNAANLTIPAKDYAARYGDVLIRVAVGATGLDSGQWLPGGPQFRSLADEMTLLDPGVPIDIWWVQGESDATLEETALRYAANMAKLDEALREETGRTFHWLDTYLHEDNPLPGRATLNEQKAEFGASIPGRWHAIDPTPLGVLVDPLHWEPALGELMTNLAVETINDVYPLVYERERGDEPGRDGE